MPSLNFTAEGGKPIAFITKWEPLIEKPNTRGLDDKEKEKVLEEYDKEVKEREQRIKKHKYNKQIIYLHDHGEGEKNISLPDFRYFPLFGKVKGEVQNARWAIIGKSGSGKSYFVGQLLDAIKSKKLGDKEREIVIYSGIKEDEALDKPRGKKGAKELPMRVDIDNPEELNFSVEDHKNAVVIFDDVEHLANKAANKKVLEIRDQLLEKGRHFNIDVITISHSPFAGNKTKMVHTESTGVVLFPSSSTYRNLFKYLNEYMGFNRTNIEFIEKLGETSRWVFISNTAPTYIIHQNGVLLLK